MMTLSDAINAYNRHPFNGVVQTSIWARANEIESSGRAQDTTAFRLACEEILGK